MSSKPGAGINHKEFGVTSEGVNVFLQGFVFDPFVPSQFAATNGLELLFAE